MVNLTKTASDVTALYTFFFFKLSFKLVFRFNFFIFKNYQLDRLHDRVLKWMNYWKYYKLILRVGSTVESKFNCRIKTII